MTNEEGAKTVVVGGSKDIQQEYCGIIGGQSTDFSTIDTEIKVCRPKMVDASLLYSGVMPRDRAPTSRIIHSHHLICTPSFSFSPSRFPRHSGALRLIHFCHCRLVNGVQGIMWRLAFGVDNPKEPEGKLR